MRKVQYHTITKEYKNFIQLPFRQFIEAYSLFQLAGDLGGQEVLDLACGEGFYTRKLKLAGAKEVIGVDTSETMIGMAEAHEQESPIGCSYIIYDVATLPYLGSFDLVVAMYLLGHAQSKYDLLDLCKVIYHQLRAGGQFIGYNDNMFNDVRCFETYRKYGFIKQGYLNQQEGDPILYTFYDQHGGTVQCNNYYLSPRTYEEVFREVGFVDFQWIEPVLDPSQRDNHYWDHFMASPPIIGFKARKAC